MSVIRSAGVVLIAVAALMPAAASLAVALPSDTLTLTTPTSTYNTLSMTVSLTSPISGSSTQSPTIIGSCSTTFNALFNPTNDQATISDITFNLQDPGSIALQNVTFSYVLGLELIKTNSVALSPYTQTPPTPTPTPVSGGLFAADQVWATFNGGTIVASGVTSSSADLSSSPIDSQNASTGSGTVAISGPTMNGSVATYTATATVPLSVNEPVSGSGYAATIMATGTLRATGSFQFNFGPQTINWVAASGDFSSSGNWDVGFAPRTSDTGSIANGGASTLSTIFPAVPAAVWIGNGSTFTIASGGSLGCGAMVLGRSGNGTLVLGGGTLAVPSISQGGGTGSLYFNGGTLVPTAASSQFITGLGATYVSTSGAIINTNGHNVTISQALLTDPALNGAPDGGLTKAGNGIATLAGANTYTGPTTVNAGTLRIGTNILPAATALTVGNSGTLDLDGGTQTVASLAGSGPVINSAGTLATLIVSGSATTTFSGGINAAGGGGIALEKLGSGVLVLSGSDNYLGGTTVEGGKLIVTQSTGLADRSNLFVGNPLLFGTVVADAVPNNGAAPLPVPEPGTLGLLVAALCGAGWAARAKHRRSSRFTRKWPAK